MQDTELTTKPLAELISAIGKHKDTPEYLKDAIWNKLNSNCSLDAFSPSYIQEMLDSGAILDFDSTAEPGAQAPVLGEYNGLEITTADLYKFSLVFCWILREKILSNDIRTSMRDLLTPLSAYMDIEQPELINSAIRRMMQTTVEEVSEREE